MSTSTREEIMVALKNVLLKLDEDPTYDSPEVSVIKRYWPNLSELDESEFPLIVMDDNGDDPGPEYEGVVRFKAFLNISGVIISDTDDEMADDLDRLSQGMKKYFYSEPALHDNVLDVMLVESLDQGAYSSNFKSYANIMNRVRILYYATMRTVASSSDEDTYGEQWIDDARDKIVARLELLKTTMASGYTPTFSYVHPRHVVPDLFLNSVSVGIIGILREPFSGSANGISFQYGVRFSIRVHTAYDDQVVDDQEAGRLVNSIVNQLSSKVNLGDGYRVGQIEGIETDIGFEESETKGAQFEVVIGKAVRYAQES